jgi:hypothetical protein
MANWFSRIDFGHLVVVLVVCLMALAGGFALGLWLGS